MLENIDKTLSSLEKNLEQLREDERVDTLGEVVEAITKLAKEQINVIDVSTSVSDEDARTVGVVEFHIGGGKWVKFCTGINTRQWRKTADYLVYIAKEVRNRLGE